MSGNEITDCLDAVKTEFELLKESSAALTTTKETLW